MFSRDKSKLKYLTISSNDKKVITLKRKDSSKESLDNLFDDN